MISMLVKKVTMKTESYDSLGGNVILLALFAQNYDTNGDFFGSLIFCSAVAF